ncbi:MAG: SPFH/Band 7/PHB domain protein [Proteobacteria bacterium]|nr:SPFH/Band 7/PHB domain protein [Pseudomonadota bacterium]
MNIIAILFVIVILLFLARGVRIVPQGYEYTVERFGRYITTLTPGLHIIIPLMDRVGMKVSMMETVLEVPSQDVITKDNAAVTVDGVIFYQILNAARSAYEVADLKNAILNLTMTNIRTVMGSMDLDELLSHREAINARLLSVVDEATNPWGTKVTRIEIKDIKPPKDLVDSMARQMKAERDKRALVLEAEGDRQAQILKAEGGKQAMILEAEGRLESARKDAEARERLACAEAEATRVVSESIRKGTVHAVNYFIAQKYVEALQHIATSPNQKLVLMPLEASSVIGSLAGIAEIAKETFGMEKRENTKTKPKSPIPTTS